MDRLQTWQRRLHEFLDANRKTRFRYGSWDCCMLVAGAVEAMTGVDLAALYRGRYATRAESRQVLTEIASGTDPGAAMERAGLREILPAPAGRGDVVLLRRPRSYSLGVVALDGVHVVMAAGRGWRYGERSRIVRAWRVGA